MSDLLLLSKKDILDNINITLKNLEKDKELLLDYKADCEKENKRPLSFDNAIDLLFTEVAGLEYELGSERLKASGYKYEG